MGNDAPAPMAAPGGDGIASIAGLLACPGCRDPLSVDPDWVRCEGCDARYPIEDGIARLAVRGGCETWGAAHAPGQGTAYQDEFQDIERAAAYDLQFRRRPLKLGVTPRETLIIRRFVRRTGRSRAILEIPCGGGRLTPAFADATDLVIEADIAVGQVRYGSQASKLAVPRVWMTASAFHVPLRSGSVDGVVCVRLLHHLPTPVERERLFAELLRVSRRFVILTYFDRHSLKHLSWRLRHPFSRKPRKPAVTASEIAALARAAGARVESTAPVSRIGSGHRYALIVRHGAA